MNARTAIALLMAPLATTGSILLTAFFDQGRGSIGWSWRRFLQEHQTASSSGAVLVVLGVAAGIPAALGLMASTELGAMTLMGSIFSCMIGRRLMSGPRDYRDVMWTVVLAWCIAAGLLRFNTLAPDAALGAQAALGPGPLIGAPLSIACSVLALVTGVASVPLWVKSMSREAEGGALSQFLGWGESSLAAVAVSATVWGPPAGALIFGSFSSWPWVITSTAVTIGALAGACLLSKWLQRVGRSHFSTTFLPSVLPVAAFLAVVIAGVSGAGA